MLWNLTILQSASYPTGSLDFLAKLQKEEEQRQSDMRSSASVQIDELSRLRLNIIIVGAGLGGLAAAIALARRGHRITVFEQAPELGEVRPFPPPCSFAYHEPDQWLTLQTSGWCRNPDPIKLKSFARQVGLETIPRIQSRYAGEHRFPPVGERKGDRTHQARPGV